MAKYSEEVAEAAGKAGKHADDVAKAAKEAVERAEDVGKAAQETASDSGSSIVFKYEHNPSDNPKVLQDVMENQNAVYGYSPSPNSESIGGYVEAIDWSNPTEVAKATARREAYHIKNDNISELVIKMKNDGYSVEEIARAANQQRNLNSVC